ncbi:hypothetical protein M885DRAFT_560954 [Pelagophyceae sp. CCMP2097]|nr:hypothetical protein M885DRAFT_560954 [Pelagophyceae sp. CCMP2097]
MDSASIILGRAAAFLPTRKAWGTVMPVSRGARKAALQNIAVVCLSGRAGANPAAFAAFVAAVVDSVLERLGDCTALHTLILGCSGLTALPSRLIDCAALTKLDLSGCSRLESLPARLNVSLNTLDVSGCTRLDALPAGLVDCAALTKLNLSGCSRLDVLPARLVDCEKLTWLNLSGCSGLTVAALDQLADCAALKTLSLSGFSGLHVLPARLVDCAALTTLNLAGCTGLTTAALEQLGDCNALTALSLSNCRRLTALPERLRECRSLTKLNLAGCAGLTKLPDWLADSQLGALDVSSSCRVHVRNHAIVFRLRARGVQVVSKKPHISHAEWDSTIKIVSFSLFALAFIFYASVPRKPATQCDDGAADDDAQAHPTASPPHDFGTLNVGGARFETSRAVLAKVEDSMLGRMFSSPYDAMLQPDPVDGSISIDRDSEWFGMILDFLLGDPPDGPCMQRTMRSLPEAAQEALMQELDYFGLEVAVFGLRPWTDGAAFRPGPAMGAERDYGADVAAGGRVVVFGGHADGSVLDSTEVLDTRTMAFTAGPDMLTARYGHAVVQIDGNRVLLVGGVDDDDAVINTNEIFHLETLTILVVGGHDGTSGLSTTEIFNLDTMAITPGPDMVAPRHGCAAVALDEHRIMLTGGSSGANLQTTEVLDIRTMAFTPGPTMGLARSRCAAVPVDARHVLVVGGWDSANTRLATTELLDVATMEFEPGPTMQAARSGDAAARLDAAQGPHILVVGGYCGVHLSTTELLTAED